MGCNGNSGCEGTWGHGEIALHRGLGRQRETGLEFYSYSSGAKILLLHLFLGDPSIIPGSLNCMVFEKSP